MTQNDSLAFTLSQMVQKNCSNQTTSEPTPILYSLTAMSRQFVQDIMIYGCVTDLSDRLTAESVEVQTPPNLLILANKGSPSPQQFIQPVANRLRTKTQLAIIEEEQTFKSSGVLDSSGFGPDGPPLTSEYLLTEKNMSMKSFYFNGLSSQGSTENLHSLHTEANSDKNLSNAQRKKCIKIKWPKKSLRINSLAIETASPGNRSRLASKSPRERIQTYQSLSPVPIDMKITLMTCKSQQKLNKRFLCLTPRKMTLDTTLVTPGSTSSRKGIRVMSKQRKQNKSKQKLPNKTAVDGVPVRNIELSTRRSCKSKTTLKPIYLNNGFSNKIQVKSRVRQEDLRWKR